MNEIIRLHNVWADSAGIPSVSLDVDFLSLSSKTRDYINIEHGP